ncbi:MAG: hypothetical protein CML97_02575 [Rhodobiaceae bacterium]|nr:hypothetical protein [Rhodobiaceae bacterium]|tara:strand:- start:772 stop:1032 length:261 start_codon:yes stop_codon:yes gene_type:complete
MDILNWLEILALLTGTLLPAPLLSSASMKQRFIGFNIMIIGNICAFTAQYGAGLEILSMACLFWIVMSIRGVWSNKDYNKPLTNNN